MYFVKKESRAYCSDSYTISLECDIIPKLIQDKQMSGFLTENKFYDIGTTEKINKYKRFFQNN